MNKILGYEEFLIERKFSDTVSIFDIDDTLLFSKTLVYVKFPGESEWKGVDTETFGKERETYPKGTEYDFKDFMEHDAVMTAVGSAKPNIPVLKELDKAVKRGDKIGIITARQDAELMFNALKGFLLYKDDKGNFGALPKNQFNKSYVYSASNQKTLKALGIKGSISDPSNAKAEIIQKIFLDKMGFKKVIFYDDDPRNIKAVQNLNDSRVTAIKV